jgi:hypothetical protein
VYLAGRASNIDELTGHKVKYLLLQNRVKVFWDAFSLGNLGDLLRGALAEDSEVVLA